MSGPWFILIGLAAGVFSGLFGIGGGIIIVPALVLLAGFPLVKATGTSLAAILPPVGILGVLAYYRAKVIDLRASAWIAAGMLTSVALGAWFANRLPVGLMRRLFAVFCLYVAWSFIDPVSRVKRALGREVPVKPEPETDPRPRPLPLVAIGLLAGVMAGMFGIGGGNIIVPLLTLALGYPTKRAIATSLGAILLPFGLPGVLVYYHQGTLDLAAAGWIALGLVIGTLFGAKTTIRLPTATVRLLYGAFLVFVSARFFFW
ncbi:MAG TPA: sulfite exporter TauE/SafE family protein [Terriglobales bacterium]|nr:sulfite exporter TauE/SafE family protein [Terriglobales bacterium]